MKICTKCKVKKPFADFRVAKKYKDGYQYHCKKCEYGHEPHKKPEVEKECKGCNIIKKLEDFSFINKEKGFRASKCRKCKSKEHHLKRMANPEKEAKRNRKRRIKSKYKDFSIEQYDKMYIEQKGNCKICNTYYTKLNIDHCHNSLIIRGLLCGKCNTGLGQFDDNSELLNKAILYLKESNTDKSDN